MLSHGLGLSWNDGFTYVTIKPWHSMFLLLPKKIDGKVYWFRTIYRRKLLVTAFQSSTFGTQFVFDVYGSQIYEWDYALDAFELMKKPTFKMASKS